MSKIYADAAEALEGVLADGMTLAVGGFGLCGIPADLIDAVRDCGVRDLTVVSNNMGVDGLGLGVLLESGRCARCWPPTSGRTSCSRAVPGRRARSEFEPAGHPRRENARRRCGIPAFYTATGVGTLVAEGKRMREFKGATYLMERIHHRRLRHRQSAAKRTIR